MKKLYFLIFLLLGLNSLGQRVNLKLGYQFGIPMEKMAFDIRRGHGFSIGGFYKVTKNSRFWVGGEIGGIIYGQSRTPQVYNFPDGTQANVDVVVCSWIFDYQLGAKYDLSLKTPSGKIQPYLLLKSSGTNFSTSLYIEDPRHEDDCLALEEDHLLKSNTASVSPGLGTTIFFDEDQRIFLDFNVSYTFGSRVSYMNPTLGDNFKGNHVHHVNNGEAYYVNFINRRTQVAHQHHVGNVFESPYQILQARFSFGIRV